MAFPHRRLAFRGKLKRLFRKVGVGGCVSQNYTCTLYLLLYNYIKINKVCLLSSDGVSLTMCTSEIRFRKRN